MGWIVSFALLCAYVFGEPVDTYLKASALFAIAGAISEVAVQVKKK